MYWVNLKYVRDLNKTEPSDSQDPLNFIWSGCADQVPESQICTDLMELLISKGLDINTRSNDKFEITPLHFAVIDCAPKGVQFLLDHGADAKIAAAGEKFKGLTPLQFLIHIDMLNKQCKATGSCTANSACLPEDQIKIRKLLTAAEAG